MGVREEVNYMFGYLAEALLVSWQHAHINNSWGRENRETIVFTISAKILALID